MDRHVWLVALLATTVGACAPYGFSKEVTDLSSSGKALGDSVTSGHKSLVDDKAADYQRALIARRSMVVVSDVCEQAKQVDRYIPTGKPPEKPPKDKPKASAMPPDPPARQVCGVYLQQDNGKAFEDPFFVVPDQVKREVKALTDYMGGLAAVTNAADRTNFDTAVGKVAASVSALASAANLAAGPIIGAGINIFGWVVGNALDIQRFEILKQVVNAVQPTDISKPRPFDKVVNAIGFHADRVAEHRRNDLIRQIKSLRATLGPDLDDETYRARLADINALAATLDALNQSSGQEAANELIKAHEQLVWAVNTYQPDLGDLLTALGTLKDKVAALQTALAGSSTGSTATSKKGS